VLFESIKYSDTDYKVAGYITCLGDDNPQQYKLLKND
jgi:hypothetical protein